MDVSDLSVIACPAPLRPAALRKLHDGLPDDQRVALVEALDRTGTGDESAWDGLLIAVESGGAATEVVGATWVQRAPGNTAIVWPPTAGCPAADALFRAAAQWCDGRSIPLSQLSATEGDGYCEEQLAACGFSRLAELLYMCADAATHSAARGSEDGGLQFVSNAEEEPQRLATLIEHTYVGTQDCPELDGLRSMPDVLAGYRAQGRHCPEHWYFAQLGGADVGVLILADHAAAGNCELIYMGVVPAVRGAGIGARIVRRAIAAAATVGAKRLVLAVDAANEPAIDLYRRAGFAEWDRRTVYAHCVRRAP